MGLREWFGEQNTGVQLLVVLVVGFVGLVGAIVVIFVLAAVVGAFVLGLGGGVDEGVPQASFSVQGDGGTVEVVHAGGEALPADRVLVRVNRQEQSWAALDPEVGSGGSVQAGDAVSISGLSSGDRIRVVWDGSGDGGTTVLASYEVP